MTKKILFYFFLIVFLIIILFPFYIMIITAFKDSKEAISYPPTLIPSKFTLDHFNDVLNPKIFPYLLYFKNSFYISVVVSIFSLVLGIFGAYALSKLDFKGRLVINNSFYTIYMFSGILLIVPLFKIITFLGLAGTREALIIAMIVQTLPTSIFMLKSYFDTIPDEISEAAIVDGLSKFKSIFYIIIPLAIPGIVSVIVYTFMISWNDYLFASIFLNIDNFSLPIGLNSLFSTPDYVWGRMMAASILTAIPVVLLYALSERMIRGGKTEGGVKG